MCRISIGQLSSGAPYYFSSPQYIIASGRVSRDCSSVEVTVRLGAGGPALFPPRLANITYMTVPAGADATLPEYDSTWSALFAFEPTAPGMSIIQCNTSLWAEARCPGGPPDCSDSGYFPVLCKDVPAGAGQPPGSQPPGGTGGGDGGTGDWDWPAPPGVWCGFLKRVFGLTLLAALIIVLTAACFPGVVSWVGAAAALAIAGAAFAAWALVCGAGYCEYWAILCWAFKNAVVVGVPLSLAALSLAGAIVTVGFGAIVAFTIVKLDAGRCPVPKLQPPPF